MSKYAWVLTLAGVATILAFMGEASRLHGQVNQPSGVLVVEETVETMAPAQEPTIMEKLKETAQKAKDTITGKASKESKEIGEAEEHFKCCAHQFAHHLKCLMEKHDGNLPPCCIEEMKACGLHMVEQDGKTMVWVRPCPPRFCGVLHVYCHHVMETPEQMKKEAEEADLTEKIVKEVASEEKAIEAEEKAIETEEKDIESEEKGIEAEEKAVETEEKAVEAGEKTVETEGKAVEAGEKAVEAGEKAVENAEKNK